MIASDRDEGITFYEELGLTRQASPDEIREAFRLLVRLLHPDQQTDPVLKAVAETQLRKLNRVYAVLSDPARRKRYDEILDEDDAPPVIFTAKSPEVRKRLAARLTWAAATLASVIGLAWLAIDGPQESGARGPDPVASQKSPDDTAVQPPGFAAELRSQLKAARSERDAAVNELKRLRGDRVSAPGVPVTITELPTAGRMAGLWTRTPDGATLTVTEEGDRVLGAYRSPGVDFTFAASQSQGPYNGTWTGAGGSKGEITLRLQSTELLRVDWVANELGSQQTQRSGSAILTRRKP